MGELADTKDENKIRRLMPFSSWNKLERLQYLLAYMVDIICVLILGVRLLINER